jgi:hypothetical protein
MQQTIGKNRWRDFLQTRGECYTRLAEEMERLADEDRECGARFVSKAINIMVSAMEYIREKRLTRQQYVLFQMANMITAVETAVALCRKAAKLKKETLQKTLEYVRTASRIYAAEVVSMVTQSTVFYLAGFGSQESSDVHNLVKKLNLGETGECYLGVGGDMDKMAQLLAEMF